MIIIGSGPSAKGFITPDDIPVIAVNGVIDWIRRADYWFSLDPSAVNIQRLSKRRPGTEYHVAYPHYMGGTYNYRRIAARGIEPQDTDSPEWWLWRWSAVKGICKTPGEIHTGNGAWGALQLAWKLGARRAVLIGIDASAERRVEGGRPKNLSHLSLLFESAMEDMEIVNCGKMQSRLPTMRMPEAIQWLQ